MFQMAGKPTKNPSSVLLCTSETWNRPDSRIRIAAGNRNASGKRSVSVSTKAGMAT